MIELKRHILTIGATVGLLSALGTGTATAAGTTAAPAPQTAAQRTSFDDKSALAQSQAAIGRKLRDHRFVSADGKAFRIADFSGKPLIISLVYSSCYHICPQITQSLARAVDVANDALGEGTFQVATIGFDTEYDKPSAMRAFAKQQGISSDDWLFLSADAPTVWRLSDDIGFSFTPSSKGFDHLTQTTIIDQQGRVYAQVYGEDFATPQLVDPLKHMVFKGGPWTGVQSLFDRVRLVCTIYDPSRDAYYFDYSLFIGMAIGFVCVAFVAGFIVREYVRSRRTPTAQGSS